MIGLLLFFFSSFLITSITRGRIIRFLLSILFSFFISINVISFYFNGSYISYNIYVHVSLHDIQSMYDLYKVDIFKVASLFITLASIFHFSHYSFFIIVKFFKNIIPPIISINNEIITRYYIMSSIFVYILSFSIDDFKFYKELESFATMTFKSNSKIFDHVVKETFLENYITKDDLLVKNKSGSKNNVIILSLESLEKGFLSDKFSDLTPNLRYYKDNWYFTEMRTSPSASWTIGSLYNLLTGFPATFGIHGNRIFQNTYYTNLSSLSHIFGKAGYRNHFIMENTSFAGTDKLLHLFDFDTVYNATFNNLNYKVEHLHDKDSFNIAKNIIDNEVTNKKPFFIIISTIDTHFPDGIYDKRMEIDISPKSNTLEFCVASADKLVNDLILFLKERKLIDNTDLYIFPDHLKMGDPKIFEGTGDRGLYLITNKSMKKRGSIFQHDLPRIILDNSNIKTNVRFLSDLVPSKDKAKFISDNINLITEFNIAGFLSNDFKNKNLTEIEKSKYKSYIDNFKKDRNRFIAHAGGIINGKKYTNSLEALNLSYSKGYRLFELDIIKTSDDFFVAAHDWTHWSKAVGLDKARIPTLEEFMNSKIYNQFSPMSMKDINKWFLIHDDAILVTDKVNSPKEFANLFIDKKRLIMELFTFSAVKEALKIGILSAMPNWAVIKDYRIADLHLLKEMGIKNIAISRRIIDQNKELLLKYKMLGIDVFAFHINFDQGFSEIQTIEKEGRFIFGIYSDEHQFNN